MLKVGNKTLMKNVRTCKTSWQRMKGLMFEDKKKFNYALVFAFPKESKIGSSLHMIFVFFPIDVLFLNTKKAVIASAITIKYVKLFLDLFGMVSL